ncbi:MAG TPA: polymer-forming cytoskeletal protein [Xanthobacteraceae bacterium]|nr:polymer-forming cytoskeletal protein [Xanthobacteraceae bacterium]
MSEPFKPEANKLYVGAGVAIKGAVLQSETVVVEGLLEGDITVTNLLVRETGTIKGRVAVSQNAEIFGKVLEKLDVRGLLILHATSRVEGNVSCGMLSIEQGATIIGGISSMAAGTQSVSGYDRQDARAGKAAAPARRVDLPMLDMPSPIPAAI